MGDVQYRGGYSVPWGYHDACGDEYCGGGQYHGGINLCYLSTPMVLKTPWYS